MLSRTVQVLTPGKHDEQTADDELYEHRRDTLRTDHLERGNYGVAVVVMMKRVIEMTVAADHTVKTETTGMHDVGGSIKLGICDIGCIKERKVNHRKRTMIVMSAVRADEESGTWPVGDGTGREKKEG